MTLFPSSAARRNGLLPAMLVLSLLLAGLALGAQPAPVAAVSPNIVISQVYGGGGNPDAPYTHDFVELFNRGDTPASVDGWSVQYASASGTGSFGGTSAQITPLSGLLAPGQYLLVQEASSGAVGTALPAPDVTDSTPINMSGTGGKVALVSTSTPLGCNGSSTPCSAAQLAQIVDLVGYGSANFWEGTAAAPTLSTAAAGLRARGGCADTDTNAADFAAGAPTPRNTASPLNACGTGDVLPTVASTTPANGAVEVALNADVNVTFSEPVSVSDGWYTIVCQTSGAHTAAVLGGPVSFTLDPGADFANNEACTVTIVAANVTDQDGTPDHMLVDYAASFGTVRLPIPIREIQGAGHLSPKAGQVVKTQGIVTALRTRGGTRGFYLQDASPDADPATSEGIFVFMGGSSNPASMVAVADSVQVLGTVSEYRAAAVGLTLTQLVGPLNVTLLSRGNPLPPAVVIGAGGQAPPAMVIEDDSAGNVESSGVFDPASDGIDFYESLEGMLVQVNDAVAVGPRSDFASNREIPIVGDGGASAGERTNRGGVVAQAADFNPERIILNDWIGSAPSLPAANVGDIFPGRTLGVIDYSFNNFKLQVIDLPALQPGGLQQETAAPAGVNQISLATFNVENLAGTDPPSKFSTLAELIVDRLQSPGILAIEEIQDNNGTTNDGLVDASTTWTTLVSTIQAAGGPTYAYRQIDPVDDQDGGAPGGNIRVGFLFRTDRGLSFLDRPGASPTTANAVVGSGAGTKLQYSPGRIDPGNPAFVDSRKPLAAEFMFNGHHLFVIANHWNSKGGDQPLFGVNQPPAFSSEVQRNQQATVVHDFVNAILTADPNADVVVMGDLNDFQFSSSLATLKGSPAILRDLIETLPVPERYTYVYEGNSETLDHILVSNNLFNNRAYAYDVVHVNSEFAAQASDHEPQVDLVTLNDAPTADAGGPYEVPEGKSITVSATGTDLENATLAYAWDLDNDGSFETPGQSATFSAATLTAPSTHTIKVQVTDDGGLAAVASATVSVIFNWDGFMKPVAYLPILNQVKAGRVVPLKFSLGGDKGLDIFADGYPKVEVIPCQPGDVIQPNVAGASGSLVYDAILGQYVYLWKTDPRWARTCRQLQLTLVDSTTHAANFEFPE